MLRLRRYAWRVLPLLLLLALYWPGLTNWFYQDDFGWLNLRHDVHSWRDLGPALFAPKAHGNIRPLGENAYFLVLSSLFGVDALPFRIVAFVTQMGSLLLLGSIARRLTASRAAGFWAQVLWIANPGLAAAMCWSSIYNQILSGFFFLLAFWFLLRYIESGAARDAIGHWTAFVLGLGALETNVMYPAIAAVYALLFARMYLKKILPMFAVSALFVFVHFRFAPPPHDGVYALHFGVRMFSTLLTYWTCARPLTAAARAAELRHAGVARMECTRAAMGSSVRRGVVRHRSRPLSAARRSQDGLLSDRSRGRSCARGRCGDRLRVAREMDMENRGTGLRGDLSVHVAAARICHCSLAS